MAITGKRELWSSARLFSTPYLCGPESPGGSVKGLFLQIGCEMLALAQSSGQKLFVWVCHPEPSLTVSLRWESQDRVSHLEFRKKMDNVSGLQHWHLCLWFNHCREQHPREETPPVGSQSGLWVPRFCPRMSLTAWVVAVVEGPSAVLTTRGRPSASGLSGATGGPGMPRRPHESWRKAGNQVTPHLPGP